MKSPDYAKLRILITSGYIVELSQITESIAKTVLQKDLRMGFVALDRRLKDPDRWLIGDLRKLAALVEN